MEKGDRVELVVASWFANKEGLDTECIEGEVKALTQKAVLVETDDRGKIWIPLSVVV